MFIEYVPKSIESSDSMSSAETCSVILGLGATGVSCARFLEARGHNVVILDSRMDPPGLTALRNSLPDVDLRLGGFDFNALFGAEQLVVSPGVSLSEPLVQHALDIGIPVLGDIELFAREAAAPVVGITGSNGKSTVTSWLASVLRHAGKAVHTGGNLAPPALDLLLEPEPDCYALELSSFQLETTVSLVTKVAAILNVSPDHIDRHGSLKAYIKAKSRILRGCSNAVINRDDPILAKMDVGEARLLSFGLSKPTKETDYGTKSIQGKVWLMRGDTPLVATEDISLAGRHNWANALAVLAICEGMDLDLSTSVAGLSAFSGLPHRMQIIGSRQGVTWIDDSKGTNVGATVAAVNGCDGPLTLIAGGDGKNADFAPLAAAVRDKVKTAIVLGKDASVLNAVLSPWCSVVQVADMEQAVATAARLSESGDTVLLSPACASLDMFEDFSERGRVFVKAFMELASD